MFRCESSQSKQNDNGLAHHDDHDDDPRSLSSFFFICVTKKAFDSRSTMAPQVRKVKSAFLWYQGEELKNVRAELGVSMGDAMTEVS
jgi:hypothetical protein